MSSISSINSNSCVMAQAMGARQNAQGVNRPDPAQLASDLFSKLDTAGQGYIEKADLKNAVDQMASKLGGSGASTNVDEVFATLDADSDGKVTKQEFSDSLTKLADQLEEQFHSARMQGAMPPMGGMEGMGGMQGTGAMAGPPPDAGQDPGMTKEQLSSAAQEVSGANSELASMFSNIAQNFDAADTNQDGKVTLQESIAYQQSQSATDASGATTSATASSSSTATAASSSDNYEAKLMMQIMKLAHAYGIGQESSGASMSSLLVTA